MSDSTISKTILAAFAAISAISLLAGCASHSDGRRMTLAECWKAMADRQDAAARAFVDTSGDHRAPNPAAPSGLQNRPSSYVETTSF